MNQRPDRNCDVDSDDESAIFESPFNLRPPVPECDLLIPPPGWPPVGWEQPCEEPPNKVPLAEYLQRALRVQREQEDRERAGSASGDVSENEDDIPLVPEGEAGVCVSLRRIGVITVVSPLPVVLKGGMRLMRSRATASGNCRLMFLLFALLAVKGLSLHLGGDLAVGRIRIFPEGDINPPPKPPK